MDLNVIVENHGGLSSNGEWLAEVITTVGHDRCGTLPDFGNFKVSDEESYDSYRGINELMPFARGVSVKDKVWDAHLKQSDLDFEYGGYEGLNASRKRLEKAREALAGEFE